MESFLFYRILATSILVNSITAVPFLIDSLTKSNTSYNESATSDFAGGHWLGKGIDMTAIMPLDIISVHKDNLFF